MKHISTVTPNFENIVASRKDIYQQVTDKIISQLEGGTVPWQKSWKDKNKSSFHIPKNFVTDNSYRGVNIVLLWCAANEKQFSSNEWASYNQWQSKKEAIKKGEKGSLIVYSDTFEKEVDGEIKQIPFLKYSTVFNRCQLASYNEQQEEITEIEAEPFNSINTIEEFVFNTAATIKHEEGGAYYNTGSDIIYMPPQTSFIDTKQCPAAENYYSTLLHEMTHWTGHNTRLNRQIKNKFGDQAYAQEELIAELGAAFLTADFGISAPEKENHASYISGWLKVLKDNKFFIISASSDASKAVDYMKGLQPN